MEFTAHPEDVGVLRRLVKRRLEHWGLHELVDTAQLCVSELVSNVVGHVGPGTPCSLAFSLTGTHLRIEVHDPDTRALPTLVAAHVDAEAGRGMTLVDALTDRWGVRLHGDRKVTWCEVAAWPASPNDPALTRAEALLEMYATLRPQVCSYDSEFGRVRWMVVERSVTDAITDLLRLLRAHGSDLDEVLDRAQSRCESAVPGGGR